MDFVVVEGLRKRFVTKERTGLIKSRAKVVEALAGVDLSIGRGRLLSLVGPNGAGKTTLVRILATLLLPDEGKAYVGGLDVVRDADKVRRIVGVMLYPDKGFFGKLTGLENLVYYGMLYGLSKSDARRRAMELLELVGLTEAKDRPYEEYSMGMKARLGVAKALINDPELVLLDEPTTGIDPLGARRIRELIRRLRQEGRTVLLTSHNLHEVEELSDEVALIVGGKIAARGPPDELKRRLGFQPVAYVKAICNGAEKAVYKSGGGEELAALIKKLSDDGCHITEAYIREPSLEEVIVKTLGEK